MGYVESEGTEQGMDWRCMVMDMGHRCGYVKIPEGHVLHGLSFDSRVSGTTVGSVKEQEVGKRGLIPIFCSSASEDDDEVSLDMLFDVHGGITFGAEMDGDWWIGFDCSHYCDAADPELAQPEYAGFAAMRTGGVVRTREYVEAECASLIRQIKEIL